jgi:octaprenyl-diphosphate synthase
MKDLDKIREPIRKELAEFEGYFAKSLKSSIPLLDVIFRYILRKKGKQIRPTFVMLSSAMLGGVTASTHTAASLIELLHTASLVHDDVVDESYERRGVFSLNAIWRSKIAVLVGDYLLAKGLLLSVETKEYELLELVSEAVKDMSEGELLQMRKSRKLDITEEEYFEIIGKKTAALIAACTACGAKAAGSDPETISKMKEFGRLAGIAFQIKDDLFDYQRNGNIGKPTVNDIKEKKMTLPLIYALRSCTSSERREMLGIIRRKSTNSRKVDKVLTFVEEYGGLEFSRLKMEEYKERAIRLLGDFPESTAKASMEALVEYVVRRGK